MNRQAGFTLIELAIVMVLIVGLLALLGTQLPGLLTKRKIQQTASAATQLARAIETARAEDTCGPLYNFLTNGCEGETAPASPMAWLNSHGITVSDKFFRGMSWNVSVATDGTYADIAISGLPNNEVCTRIAETINETLGVTDVTNATDTTQLASSNAPIRAVCDTTVPQVTVRVAGYRIW